MCSIHAQDEMAQILLQAAALIGDEDTKLKSRKRVRKTLKSSTRPKQNAMKKSYRPKKVQRILPAGPTPQRAGAVELGAWLRSMEVGTIAVR